MYLVIEFKTNRQLHISAIQPQAMLRTHLVRQGTAVVTSCPVPGDPSSQGQPRPALAQRHSRLKPLIFDKTVNRPKGSMFINSTYVHIETFAWHFLLFWPWSRPHIQPRLQLQGSNPVPFHDLLLFFSFSFWHVLALFFYIINAWINLRKFYTFVLFR